MPTYRKSDYLTVLEKSLNPNVGPGSYNPVNFKTNAANAVDWSKGTERFKQKKEPSRNVQQHSYVPHSYVPPHMHAP
jgi:hypothetical protein